MCEVRRAVGFGNTKIGDPGVELGVIMMLAGLISR